MNDMYESQIDDLSVDIEFVWGTGEGSKTLSSHAIRLAHEEIETRSGKPNWMESWVYANPDLAKSMPKTFEEFFAIRSEGWLVEFLLAVPDSFRNEAYEFIVEDALAFYDMSVEYDKKIEEKEMPDNKWEADFYKGVAMLFDAIEKDFRKKYPGYVIAEKFVKDEKIYDNRVFVRDTHHGLAFYVAMYVSTYGTAIMEANLFFNRGALAVYKGLIPEKTFVSVWSEFGK